MGLKHTVSPFSGVFRDAGVVFGAIVAVGAWLVAGVNAHTNNQKKTKHERKTGGDNAGSGGDSTDDVSLPSIVQQRGSTGNSDVPAPSKHRSQDRATHIISARRRVSNAQVFQSYVTEHSGSSSRLCSPVHVHTRKNSNHTTHLSDVSNIVDVDLFYALSTTRKLLRWLLGCVIVMGLQKDGWIDSICTPLFTLLYTSFMHSADLNSDTTGGFFEGNAVVYFSAFSRYAVLSFAIIYLIPRFFSFIRL